MLLITRLKSHQQCLLYKHLPHLHSSLFSFLPWKDNRHNWVTLLTKLWDTAPRSDLSFLKLILLTMSWKIEHTALDPSPRCRLLLDSPALCNCLLPKSPEWLQTFHFNRAHFPWQDNFCRIEPGHCQTSKREVRERRRVCEELLGRGVLLHYLNQLWMHSKLLTRPLK